MSAADRESASEAASPLARRLAAVIADDLRERQASPGDHLKAGDLAERFEVSRFPVREALVLLEGQGILESRPFKGFFVREVPKGPVNVTSTRDAEDALFLRISRDKLAGVMPDEFTESDLMRNYNASRREVRQALERLSQERWIRRRMGHGWRFAPLLTSPEALSQSYRLRMALEPAALLEPSFRIDAEAFESWRQTMKEVRQKHSSLSNAELLRIGSGFHEMLMACTRNPFFVDMLKRQNQLRVMIERHVPADHDHTLAQIDEHLEMLDRLQDGDSFGASTLMRRHLDVVGSRKVKSIAGGFSAAPRRRPTERASKRG
ncbi:MAG: GntR family transcriptional regulator [Acetobacterales bacterium]